MRTLRTLIRGLNVNYVMVLRCKIPDYLIKQLLTGDFGQFVLLLTGQVLFDQGLTDKGFEIKVSVNII